MKTAIPAVFCLLFGLARIGSLIADESTSDMTRFDVIRAPMDWAAGYFSASRGNDLRLVRRELDLDHDKKPELLIGFVPGQSQNGIPFVIFQRLDDGYRYLGELFFHRDLSNIKVLPLGEDGGIRIAQLWHRTAEETGLGILTHNGSRFVTVESRTLRPRRNEADKRTLEEIFGR